MEEDEGEDGATATATNEAEARAAIERAREIYREANVALRKSADKEQRVQLIDAWKEFEVGGHKAVVVLLGSGFH